MILCQWSLWVESCFFCSEAQRSISSSNPLYLAFQNYSQNLLQLLSKIKSAVGILGIYLVIQETCLGLDLQLQSAIEGDHYTNRSWHSSCRLRRAVGVRGLSSLLFARIAITVIERREPLPPPMQRRWGRRCGDSYTRGESSRPGEIIES